MRKYYRLFLSILLTSLLIFTKPLLDNFADTTKGFLYILYKHSGVLTAISVAWVLIEVVGLFKVFVLSRFDINKIDNLGSRKVYTQIDILEKVVVFVIILFTIGFVLLSFDSIRDIGVALFASAGLAGIIIGLSAQKVVGALLAGIQIAITQPFRIDDVVFVEDEWGRIEEINLTYVVVRIWDKRRLVLPSNYFLEKPFQNWTRASADLVGSVFIYTDYMVPFDALRQELTRLLSESELWDRSVNLLQVTNCKESTVEIRMLVSAADSSALWDLRVYVREKMIEFIQKNYPEILPKTRILLH